MTDLTLEERLLRIRELKQAIEELEAGLPDDIQQQHEQIDQLDEYFNVVETKFTSLKVFWQSMKDSVHSK